MKPYNIGTLPNINNSIYSNSMVPTLYYFSPNNSIEVTKLHNQSATDRVS